MADIKLDPANVPPELHPLIPYAEKWGIRDHDMRRALLDKAPLDEIEAIFTALYAVWDAFVNFTIFQRPEASDEVEVFDAFRGALSDTYNILTEHNPKRLLEIIGFPETCPAMKFDHDTVPSELVILIPHAEKWVIDDEGVRGTVLQASTNSEIAELLSAINQIGEPQIRELLSKMFEIEMQRQAAYVFALLLEVAEQAARLLKKRAK